MVTYRKARPEEREAYIAFANMVFTNNGDVTDFETLVPKVYGANVDSSDMHYLAVDDEKGIRGLLAVMPNELYIGGETLKIGYIGSVSVHPEARGEGHMKVLMNMAIEDMKNGGVDISLLGGHRQRYEYFDFAKGGIGYSVTISEPNVKHALKHVDASDVRFEEITFDSSWVDPAYAMFEKQQVRFCRNRTRFVDICCNYNCRPWAILCGGAFAGYLICNTAKDGIAEMIVESADVLDKAVKAWILQNNLKRIQMSLPVWNQDMLKRLGCYAGDTSFGMRVQSSVYNPRKVLKAMLTAKSGFERLEDGCLTLNVEGDHFTVEMRNGLVRVYDGGENPVCLNRLQASQLFAYAFDYEGRAQTPAGWFPLPLYETAPDGF